MILPGELLLEKTQNIKHFPSFLVLSSYWIRCWDLEQSLHFTLDAVLPTMSENEMLAFSSICVHKQGCVNTYHAACVHRWTGHLMMQYLHYSATVVQRSKCLQLL